MKKIISIFLTLALLVCLCPTVFASSRPSAYIYPNNVSHFTDQMPVKFKLTDDKSLKNGFFVFLLGHPSSGNVVQLYAEQITEDSSSVILNRTIDIRPAPDTSTATIYLVVIDSDGNESLYDTYVTINSNHWAKPAIRVLNPLPDTSDSDYRVYNGPTYPSITPSITITDYNSTSNFTCKYFVDNEVAPRETKVVSFSNTGTNTLTFNNQLNLGALGSGYHKIRFEVTDSSGNIGYFEFNILLQ